jgi:hypothetical protein
VSSRQRLTTRRRGFLSPDARKLSYARGPDPSSPQCSLSSSIRNTTNFRAVSLLRRTAPGHLSISSILLPEAVWILKLLRRLSLLLTRSAAANPKNQYRLYRLDRLRPGWLLRRTAPGHLSTSTPGEAENQNATLCDAFRRFRAVSLLRRPAPDSSGHFVDIYSRRSRKPKCDTL